MFNLNIEKKSVEKKGPSAPLKGSFEAHKRVNEYTCISHTYFENQSALLHLD